MIPYIIDTTTGRKWSAKTGWTTGITNPRKYTLTIVNRGSLYSGGALSEGTYLGIQAGSIATSSGEQIVDVIGGLNLFDNPKYSLGKDANNALCRTRPTIREVTPSDKVEKY